MKKIVAICLSSAAALLAPCVEASDLDQLVVLAAKIESGVSSEPLRQIERMLCEAAGKPERQAELEAALLRLLAPDTTFEAKRFACMQLAVHGSEASLPALAALLTQEETAGLACFALNGLRLQTAGDVLRKALPGAKGAARLQLVNALSHRAEKASVAPLSDLVHDADAAVASAAIRALGAIDAASAREAVAALRKEAAPAVAAAVAEASLSGAEQLAAAGDRAAAAGLCEELLKAMCPPQIRRGAFSLCLRCDTDEGQRRIGKLLAAEPLDRVLAAVAIARIPELHGKEVSKTFGKALPKLPPSEQVLLIEALACRADSDARSVIRKQLAAADPGVRHAALTAAGAIEDASAVALLVQALASASAPEEAKEVQLALAGLRGGEATDRAICDALHEAAVKDRPPLMVVLSRRGGPVVVSALLEQSVEADGKVARAAAQALARIADSGDSTSLAALQKAVACGDARVREASLRTLAAWRGMAAWDTLAGIYLKPDSDAQHALALRGLSRIAGDGNAHPDDALIGRYRQLLAGARNDDERKLILNVLAGAVHPDAISMALPLLDVPGVRAEAAQAVERIAKAIETAQPEAARNALQKLK